MVMDTCLVRSVLHAASPLLPLRRENVYAVEAGSVPIVGVGFCAGRLSVEIVVGLAFTKATNRNERTPWFKRGY